VKLYVPLLLILFLLYIPSVLNYKTFWLF
jgi:hypothetical protein